MSSNNNSNIGNKLINAAIIGGVVFVGYEVLVCSRSSGGIAGCLLGDAASAARGVADTSQSYGEQVQCKIPGANKLAAFPVSPWSWFAKYILGDDSPTLNCGGNDISNPKNHP